MPDKVSFFKCAHCGSLIPDDSSPAKECYENSRIGIESGSTMLLPAKVVAANGNGSHSAPLDGYYCRPACLMQRIVKLLHLNA